jgi:hypothetical protein
MALHEGMSSFGGERLVRDVAPRRAPVKEFAEAGECLVYSAARDEATALNKTATEIWVLCDGTRDVEAITRVLADRYGVAPRLLVDDVVQTVCTFHEKGLVEFPTHSHPDVG